MLGVVRRFVVVFALGMGVSGCGGCPAPLPSGWVVVRDSEPGALLSVRMKDGVVWAAGGDPDGPSGPAHATLLVDDDPFDGADFVAVDTGVQGDWWWVDPLDAQGAYLGGSFGRVAFIDRSKSPPTLTERETPASGLSDADIIVFGVYAASPDDVWAVGGRTGGQSGGFVWRAQGGGPFTPVILPVDIASDAMWKVAGTGPDDVWIVGTRGLAFHVEAGEVTAVPVGIATSLFTVHVDARGPMAVGGLGRGLVVTRAPAADDEEPWRDVSPDGDDTPPLIGVHRSATVGLVVGDAGAAYAIAADGSITPEPFGVPVFSSLHGCFVDDDSGLAWAAGGQLTGLPLRSGVLLRRAP